MTVHLGSENLLSALSPGWDLGLQFFLCGYFSASPEDALKL